MRTLVLWADDQSPNLGVRVLGAGTASFVRTAFPGSEITHLSYGLDTGPMRVGSWRALVKERVTRTNGLMEWLAGFDLVIDTRAGDSFADIYGLNRLANMSLLADLVRQAGVPVVMGPQTIGPFETRRGAILGRISIRRSALVLARDSTSAEVARKFGARELVCTTDTVFALPVPSVSKTVDVALNVSGLLWNPNPHVDHKTYRQTVRTLAERLLRGGREVVLLAHVLESASNDNDVPAVLALADELDGRATVFVPNDLEDVRRAVAAARVVIGSRMHACLNALSCGTPAVSLAYSRKFGPLMRDLGWQCNVDLRSTDDPVARVLEYLDSESLSGDAAELREHADSLLGRGADALRSVK